MNSPPRVLPCGPDAVLIEVGSLDEVAAVRAAVLAAELPSVVDVVPAARTVLVQCAPGAGVAAVTKLVGSGLVGSELVGSGVLGGPVGRGRPGGPAGRTVTVPVSYDGPDLGMAASSAGLTVDEVVALHTGAEYTVAFCGFAPGFGYLTGLPEKLRQPRLDTPRPSVPAGSVGIAGPYTGVYPRSSPGGWRLLGHTTAVLFDPTREPPALLAPGDRVRFEVAPC